MGNIYMTIVALAGIDFVLICLKYYEKTMFKENLISWKLILILQIPLFIILNISLLNTLTMYRLLLFAMIICVVLGFYFNYKGKKSAIEPIEAEIIDINYIKNEEHTIYLLTVKYIVNGVEYINKNIKGFVGIDKEMMIGNKISIKYNPKNPNDIYY